MAQSCPKGKGILTGLPRVCPALRVRTRNICQQHNNNDKRSSCKLDFSGAQTHTHSHTHTHSWHSYNNKNCAESKAKAIAKGKRQECDWKTIFISAAYISDKSNQSQLSGGGGGGSGGGVVEIGNAHMQTISKSIFMTTEADLLQLAARGTVR